MPDLTLEMALHARKIQPVVGVDEAGRGPLAGPVAAAAVILPEGFSCPGLDDSKKLSASKRDRLFGLLTTCAGLRWSVALVHADQIDSINILRATHLAMEMAVRQLDEQIGHCLIDGSRVPGFPWPHDGIVKGDGLSLSIAAASIIAKVTRDRWMLERSREFPQYGFERHQGYGTKAHLEALRIHGPCCIHRRSFQPVAQLSLPFGGA